MSASSHYEKIALTKQELAHVYKQFVDAAQKKYEQHLPVSGRHDPLQIEVENSVNEMFAEVFEMAKWALIVDGNDFAENDISMKEFLSLRPTEEVMPLDTQLNSKLRTVIQEVEKETTEVTRLRRELPERAKDAYESLISSTDEDVTAFIKNLNEKYETSQEDEIHPELLETIPSAQDLLSDYEESIARLSALKNELPRQLAQMESWNSTIEFLEERREQQQAEKKLL
ncbi:hypothetical protein FT663_02650 [Candidozyma haemuli var. vulneris]|uniref:Uncharacterized protein n=1 Tax=Candidozyma haemuli TaxID=45357 RepID=A0A2V1AMK0_9ASCO|nr:hypothetical protein CXQ85_001606 [[Candida] haemuloni]KAF3988079.1 hypothetical protein FT662_03614 [[Candida] haemuloni var. vulneris]KAF3991568.1 hypothetical protein FT663_02650 [[Candida] haemuloni var. vulneris]PVH19300.1 hypothetical protein CXQ85_001606 [[Candida] haemuloni]